MAKKNLSQSDLEFRAQWKDPRWQKKRLEVMQDANWECENCGDKATTLNVHHKRYIKGRKVWEYERELLVCLCEPCHEVEHQQKELLLRILVEAGPGAIHQVIGLAAGYLDANCMIDPGLAHMALEGNELFYELGVAAAALEYLGHGKWRVPVREVVATKPSTPTMKGLVELWNEKGVD